MRQHRRTFVKQMSLGMCSIPFFDFSSNHLNPFESSKATIFPRTSPEKQGVSSTELVNLLKAINNSGIEFHSLMILRHGKIIAEGWWNPFMPEDKHTLYSLSKSFTSTAIGMAIEEGLLDRESTVISFFPEFAPATISQNLASMEIRHLLTMSTGHDVDTMPALRNATGESWIKTFLNQPVTHAPGTHFLYNTGATYLLSAILQKKTKQTLVEFLQPRLFEPLGITNYDWEMSPEGINTGGFGLRLTTEEIAKFGELYLQKGKWQNKQLISPTWIEEATSAQIKSGSGDNDWSQGYGYQFWRCKPGFYRGDGAFGQFCIVIPQKDTVVAITSESSDLQKSMSLIWDNLLPALKEDTLPENKDNWNQLKNELKNLSLPVPQGLKKAAIEANISGKEFKLEDNSWGIKSVAFNFSPDACTFTVTDANKSYIVKAGLENWIVADNKRNNAQELFPMKGRTAISTKIAANAIWKDENTLQMNWKYTENVHGDKIICVFNNDSVAISFINSTAEIAKKTDKWVTLNGKLVS